jgi:Methyltransferase domain
MSDVTEPRPQDPGPAPAGAERPNHFDADVAAVYDADAAAMFAPGVIGPAVDVLQDLAGGGAALEFAIGTGRVALPLSARGVAVSGIEYSHAMIDVLRAKPGADRIRVVQGDMAVTRVPGAFRLVYLVFNTIGNLTVQADQVACFVNAAAHLEPGGAFVIEMYVPQLRLLAPGAMGAVSDLTGGHACIDTHDPVNQLVQSHHFTRDAGGGFRRGFTPQRYVWPAELDLMARIAGLEKASRWGDWDRSAFTGGSAKHVSVWRKPG